MERLIVVVRAWGGEPLKRVFMGRGRGLIYLANPDSLEKVESGESSAVGFPVSDVFQFDEAIFRNLMLEWEAGRLHATSHDWTRLSRFPASAT